MPEGVGEDEAPVAAAHLHRAREGPQVEALEDPGGEELGVGGVDELEALVDPVAVDGEGVHATPDVVGALEHHHVDPALAEHLGAAQPGEPRADHDDRCRLRHGVEATEARAPARRGGC
ncbi:MAG TPA: hypothetical protein PLS29_05300 [Acidimicrobiales bacterium]|nr:hypothetical protein [Acidimicrobiales bacterium]